MSKKSAIYNFVGVLLVLFGLALIGISIFLFAKSGFNTLSQVCYDLLMDLVSLGAM
jgi:uncharacterized membrane protein